MRSRLVRRLWGFTMLRLITKPWSRPIEGKIPQEVSERARCCSGAEVRKGIESFAFNEVPELKFLGERVEGLNALKATSSLQSPV